LLKFSAAKTTKAKKGMVSQIQKWGRVNIVCK